MISSNFGRTGGKETEKEEPLRGEEEEVEGSKGTSRFGFDLPFSGFEKPGA